MPVATREITVFGNHILNNLKELAKFDLKNDIQSMGGSKLNIDTNGSFRKVNGLFKAFGRSDDSSLTNEFNRKTVTNLLKAAVDKFKNEGVTQDREFRKALIDAIRGYRWLLSSYMANRTGNAATKTSLETSLKELDKIQKDFCDSLKNAINKMDGFHLWFASTQPEMKFQNSTQAVYLDNKDMRGGGICGGISTKWLCRWVASGKASILDSSKPRSQNQDTFNLELDTLVNNYRGTYRVEWLGMVARYGGSEAAAEFQLREHFKPLLSSQNGRVDPTLNRLQKKGSEMFVAQKERDAMKTGGNLKDIMQNATRLRESANKAGIQAQIYADAAAKAQDQTKVTEYTTKFQEKQKESEILNDVALKRAGFQSQNPIVSTEDFLNRIATKYAQTKTEAYVTHKFSRTMYFCDASDFETEIGPVIQPLISDSEVALGNGNRVGYGISWRAGELSNPRGYKFSNKDVKISESGGHALGFHIANDRSFLVFDPNYGEFRCATGDDVIKHFSRWFSLYSRDTALESVGVMKFYKDFELTQIIQNDPMAQMQENFDFFA